jgi:hypothetical protein
MKTYCVSSTTFESLEEAEDCLAEWAENKTLCSDARVYEVKKSYYPEIQVELKEEK